MASTVMEGRKRPGKRLARLAHKLRHVVTKLAPDVGPLVREASGEASRLVREAASLLGCSGGNVEEQQEPEASKLTESGRYCCFFVLKTDSSSSDSSQLWEGCHKKRISIMHLTLC